GAGTGRGEGRICPAPDAPALPLLRPPGHRRRRRNPLPAVGRRSVRAAVPPGAPRVNGVAHSTGLQTTKTRRTRKRTKDSFPGISSSFLVIFEPSWLTVVEG